ncbi:MAG: DUF2231 domain-containing protein [Bacteroidia bacterium]
MPFHPQTVHFPIALLFAAFGFYLWFAFRPQDWRLHTSQILHFSGVIAMAVAIFSGRQAVAGLSLTSEAEAALNRHELLGYLSVWLFAGLGVWQYVLRGKLGRTGLWVFVAIFAAALVAMSVGAHVGGKMVYVFGVGVSP